MIAFLYLGAIKKATPDLCPGVLPELSRSHGPIDIADVSSNIVSCAANRATWCFSARTRRSCCSPGRTKPVAFTVQATMCCGLEPVTGKYGLRLVPVSCNSTVRVSLILYSLPYFTSGWNEKDFNFRCGLGIALNLSISFLLGMSEASMGVGA